MVGISASLDIDGSTELVRRIFKRYEDNLKRIGEECLTEANREITKWTAEEIKKRYNEAMEDFYKAYPRKQYKPRKSMLDQIDVYSNPDEAELGFQVKRDSLVGPDRHGNNSLVTFKKIWEEGYHGGATKGDYTRIEQDGKEVKIYTPHPSPGTPYYRKGPHFLSWGREAVKTTPPNDLWGDKRKELEKEANEKWAALVIEKLNRRKGEIFR